MSAKPMDWLMETPPAPPTDGHRTKSPAEQQPVAPTGDGHAKTPPSHDDIEKLAFALWEQRQRNAMDGSPEQDWYEAEQRLHPGERVPGE